MRVKKMRMSVEADDKSYFWVRWNGSAFVVTLSDSSGHPLHITGLSVSQLHGLVDQCGKARYARDCAIVEKLLSKTQCEEAAK